MNRDNDPKDDPSSILQYEPTGMPEYEHDFYNMTDKKKAQDIIDNMMMDYLSKGGAITKLPTKKAEE